MLVIVHALVGGLLGEKIHSIPLIIISSLVLHFLMDIIPHYDANFDKKRFLTTGEAILNKRAKIFFITDHIIALIIIAALYQMFDSKRLLIGAFVALVPDIVGLGYKTKLRGNRYYMKFLKFHSKIQRHTTFKKSMISQGIIIFFLVCIYLIIYRQQLGI